MRVELCSVNSRRTHPVQNTAHYQWCEKAAREGGAHICSFVLVMVGGFLVLVSALPISPALPILSWRFNVQRATHTPDPQNPKIAELDSP